tara:strand:- start:295 stop:633 length:339 start_codon:yes stop_codon:yes gene_type:complete
MCTSGDQEWTEADDMGLYDRLAHARVSHLSAPDLALVGPDEVYVLIFNMEMGDKGIYALRGRAMRARSHVLAFEDSIEASQFAQQLEARSLIHVLLHVPLPQRTRPCFMRMA